VKLVTTEFAEDYTVNKIYTVCFAVTVLGLPKIIKGQVQVKIKRGC